MNRKSHSVMRLVAGLVLAGVSAGAMAGIDAFTVTHRSGPCSDAAFPLRAAIWSAFKSSGTRIPIATSETVVVTLYGRWTNRATDATGADLFEWIDGKGTNSQGKDWVKVAVRAEPQHGTGDRNVTVSWPSFMVPGREALPFRVVADCANLRGLGFRIASTPPSERGARTAPPAPPKPLVACTVSPSRRDHVTCG